MKSDVLLASLTTFHIGGPARAFAEARTDAEIEDAIIFAREKKMPMFVLGNGSNLLVPDVGVEGVVLKMAMNDIAFEKIGDDELLIAGAGIPWEEIVNATGGRGLFGIENLAGIPGTMGGAVVQNIGAYGVEISSVFEYADTIDYVTGVSKRIVRSDAEFEYRGSFFKKNRTLIITRAALRLSKNGVPNISYPDLASAYALGAPLNNPKEISDEIRRIRTLKFPNIKEEGTAGSFFKNPVITRELADSLAQQFSGLPTFPQSNGRIKISLAWLLDHALSLKGFSRGRVRLYENQPMIIVTSAGATADEVDSFANEIAERVFKTTGVVIEREVETFGVIK